MLVSSPTSLKTSSFSCGSSGHRTSRPNELVKSGVGVVGEGGREKSRKKGRQERWGEKGERRRGRRRFQLPAMHLSRF